MLDPRTIKDPSDLREGMTLVSEGDETIRLTLPRRFGFNFHWLREVALGSMRGDLGLRIGPDAAASLQLTVAGAFRRVISLDEQKWLRLQVFKRNDRELNFASRISAVARAETPMPGRLEELTAAILGVHEAQWLKELPAMLERLGPKIEKLLPGISADRLERFLRQWEPVGQEAAEQLWKRAGGMGGLASARKLQPLLGSGTALLEDREFRETLTQLKTHALERIAPAALERGLGSLTAYDQLDAWAKQQLTDLFGRIESETELGKLAERLRAAVNLKDSIYRKVASALERKFTAEVCCRYQSATEETALLDCSFDFSEAGLRAYRQALDGEYSGILSAESEHVRLRQGVFTHGMVQETRLELHLPFLDRKEWSRRLESFARMEVESDEDGRLLVYHVDAAARVACKNSYQSTLALAGGLSIGRKHSSSNFTLSYNDKRRLPGARVGTALAPVLRGYGFDEKVEQWLDESAAAAPGGKVELSLSLSIPGTLVAAWLDAPDEHAPSFFPIYSQVSVAVQSAMRRWLPYAYFEDPDRYDTLAAAFPLVVYRASRPFGGKPKTDFSYDVLNDKHMSLFLGTAARGMRKELTRIHQLLLTLGKARTAAFYHPSQAPYVLESARRQRNLLNALLVADAFFVDALINLGCRASRLREEMSREPQKAVKNLAGFAAQFVKAFHGKLRRLYGGRDFLPLGSMLLVEATRALNEQAAGAPSIGAVLRVAWRENGNEQTFVNPAYRP